MKSIRKLFCLLIITLAGMCNLNAMRAVTRAVPGISRRAPVAGLAHCFSRLSLGRTPIQARKLHESPSPCTEQKPRVPKKSPVCPAVAGVGALCENFATRLFVHELSLHLAVAAGDPQMLKRLLFFKGSQINDYDSQGRTPLIVAVEKRQYECARLLVAVRAKVNLAHKETKETPLFLAVKQCYESAGESKDHGDKQEKEVQAILSIIFDLVNSNADTTVSYNWLIAQAEDFSPLQTRIQAVLAQTLLPGPEYPEDL